MATFFGEIVESSSRAFLDDDDDEFDENSTVSEEHKCKYAVSWHSEVSSEPACETLLIISGSVAIAFAEKFLLNGVKTVGTVLRSHPCSDDKKSMRKFGDGKLYSLQNKILVCLVIGVLDTEAIPFIESMTELLKKAKTQVVALTSEPLNHFRSVVPLPDDVEGFLRSLATEDPPPLELGISCPSLEIPNLISGVPAAVLTWCQLEKVPSRLIVCYSEESCGLIDSRTLGPLMPLLKCIPFSLISQKSDFTSQLPVSHNVSGNMYQ